MSDPYSNANIAAARALYAQADADYEAASARVYLTPVRSFSASPERRQAIHEREACREVMHLVYRVLRELEAGR